MKRNKDARARGQLAGSHGKGQGLGSLSLVAIDSRARCLCAADGTPSVGGHGELVVVSRPLQLFRSFGMSMVPPARYTYESSLPRLVRYLYHFFFVNRAHLYERD